LQQDKDRHDEDDAGRRQRTERGCQNLLSQRQWGLRQWWHGGRCRRQFLTFPHGRSVGHRFLGGPVIRLLGALKRIAGQRRNLVNRQDA